VAGAHLHICGRRSNSVYAETADSAFIVATVRRDLKTSLGLSKSKKQAEEEAMSAY
jgi:hypothetical protein